MHKICFTSNSTELSTTPCTDKYMDGTGRSRNPKWIDGTSHAACLPWRTLRRTAKCFYMRWQPKLLWLTHVTAMRRYTSGDVIRPKHLELCSVTVGNRAYRWLTVTAVSGNRFPSAAVTVPTSNR
jgi:hypothetical protein